MMLEVEKKQSVKVSILTEGEKTLAVEIFVSDQLSACEAEWLARRIENIMLQEMRAGGGRAHLVPSSLAGPQLWIFRLLQRAVTPGRRETETV
jgi:hypothetical protein